MRSNTSVTICALAISLGFAASSARADERSPAIDTRTAPVSGPTQPSSDHPAVRPDQPSATEAEAGTPKPLRLSLKDPEQRFADRPMPVAMHDIHYDDTPQGIPSTVTTVAFVRKF